MVTEAMTYPTYYGYNIPNTPAFIGDTGLGQMLAALWRRKWLIIAFTIVGFVLGLAVLTQIQPVFRAEARLLVTPPPTLNASSYLLSEVEAFHTAGLAESVVRRLNLHEGNEDAVHVESDILLSRLRAIPVGRANVIAVEADAFDPYQAAKLANAAVDVYLSEKQSQQDAFTSSQTLALQARADKAQADLNAAVQAVSDYKSNNDVMTGYRAEIATQQISELSAQLTAAIARQAEAEARLSQAQTGSLDLSTLPEVHQSPFIQSLKRQESELQQEYSELSTRYAPKHPRILNVKAALREVNAKLKAEAAGFVDTFRHEVEISKASVAALSAQLKSHEDRIAGKQDDSSVLAELERVADAQRSMHDSLLERLQTIQTQEDFSRAQARVLSAAMPPRSAHSPNRPAILAFSTLAGLFMATMIAFMMEQFDTGIRTRQQAEDIVGAPCFTSIPSLTGRRQLKNVTEYIIDKPYSAAAEAIRSLRVTLFASKENPPKVICVTSAIPGEGKTTVSLWLAQSLSQSGKKVLVLDCDLRKPTVHEKLGISNEKTLLDFLQGTEKFADVVQKHERSGLACLPGREMSATDHDLLGGEKMSKLLEAVREKYDVVIIDTPPIAALADARLLAGFADSLLFVVRWGSTPREAISTAMAQLEASKLQPHGVVLSKVDLKSQGGYQYKKHKQYFRD